ncbi:MAG: hypothetical protein AAF430_07455 [Myxococcota bacterium]
MAKLNLKKISKKSAEAPEAPATETEATETTPASTAEADELSRLRGILFGSAINEQEQALARIENRMAAHAAEVRGEIDALGRRLENRISELGARANQDQNSVREQLLGQSELLKNSVQERSDQTLLLVNRGIEELREHKIDRTKLSEFLLDLGSRLEGEHTDVANEDAR